eukprot:6459503-Amphidinium_carterae.2
MLKDKAMCKQCQRWRTAHHQGLLPRGSTMTGYLAEQANMRAGVASQPHAVDGTYLYFALPQEASEGLCGTSSGESFGWSWIYSAKNLHACLYYVAFAQSLQGIAIPGAHVETIKPRYKSEGEQMDP